METQREARIVMLDARQLERLSNTRRMEPPDLFLVDASAAGLDAASVLRRLRGDERLRHVPVVFLCDDELQGRRFMAAPDRPNAFLVKPVTPAAFEEVVRRVRNWNLRLDLPERDPYQVIRWPFQLAAREGSHAPG